MNSKAQTGLEYLATYGWALVLIGTVVAVLTLIVAAPLEEDSFRSSDPTKLLVKGGLINNQTHGATIKLQNITGGKIKVNSVIGGNGYYNCTYVPISTVDSGGKLELNCQVGGGTTHGTIAVEYTDQTGLIQNTVVSSRRSIAMGPTIPESGNDKCSDGIDNDNDSLVDCADPGCIGYTGQPGGALCEQPEATCDDGFDNDADEGQPGGGVDCDDDDCASFPGCTEICDNGIDDDGDGYVDCVDTDCPVKTFCDAGQTKICWSQSCIDVPCPLNQDCFADLTLDGQVDNADLEHLTGWWVQSCSVDNLWCDGSDLDCSGSVNFDDYTYLTGSYGSCP